MGLRKLTYKYDLSLREISRFLLLSQEIWHTTSEGIHLHGKKAHQFKRTIDPHWFKMPCFTCLVFSCVYCFFLKRWNYINIFALHCMNKPYFCRIFFLTDWRHERLKNTINRLLFYGEHFPWIFGRYHSFYK